MVPTTSTPSLDTARSSDRAAAPPAALPAAAPPAESVTLLGPTTYEVRRGDRIVGYVDIVGGVYVALAGSRYDHAVEVRQSIVLDVAVAALSGAGEAA